LEPETRLPIDPSKEEVRVFLSYSHDDISICDRLGKDLSMQGIKVIVERSNLQLADPLKERLSQLISAANATICIVSRRSLKSVWVSWEILQHKADLEKVGKKLIPAFVDKSFFDDDFVNTVGKQAQAEIESIIKLTAEHTNRGEPTPHLDTKRKFLIDMKSNLSFIVDKFRLMSVASLADSEYIRTVTDIYGQLTKGGKPPFPIGALDLRNLDVKARQMEIGNLLIGGEARKAAICAMEYVKDFMAWDRAKIGKAISICAKLSMIEMEIHDPAKKIQFRIDVIPEILDLIQDDLVVTP
jgi:hypothetical protein